MTIETLFVVPMTILTATTSTNGRGDEVTDWSDPDTLDVMGWLAQQQRSEPQDFRDAAVSEWVAYLPTGTAITQGNRVLANGVTFSVEGPPWEALDPIGDDDHIEATLRQVDG